MYDPDGAVVAAVLAVAAATWPVALSLAAWVQRRRRDTRD